MLKHKFILYQEISQNYKNTL